MAEQMARLIEVSVQLNSTLNLDELLQFIIRSAAEILDCESVSILLYDENVNDWSSPPPPARTRSGWPKPRCLWIIAWRGRSSVKTSASACLTYNTTPRHYLMASKHVDFEVKNLMGVPMRIKDKADRCAGSPHKHDGNFDESDADILAVIALAGGGRHP